MNQLFYTPNIENGLARLDEEESRHLLKVLRRQEGDRLQLTDGKGFFYEAEIAEAGKKLAVLRLLETHSTPEPTARLHLAIAPTKQIDRLEWCLEKATEIGIQEITPILCQRSERKNIRLDRLEKVLVSAMKQSLQSRLPRLNPLTKFTTLVKNAAEIQRFIAWCPDTPPPHLNALLQPATDAIILIGPEGDFTPEELLLAEAHKFAPIGLGPTRLRTETAGLVTVMAFHLRQLV